MIKTRLWDFYPTQKKSIVYTILWQWAGIALTGAGGILRLPTYWSAWSIVR